MFFNKYSILFCSLLSVAACQSSGTSAMTATELPDTAQYTLTHFYKSSKYLANKEEGHDTTYLRASFPVFQDSSINSLVKDAIYSDGEDNMDQVSEAFIMAFNEFVEESSVTDFVPWYTERTIRVFQNTPLLLTLTNHIEEYTGGAHGLRVVLFKHYDRLKKKEIKLNDLFSKDAQQELVKIAERIFRKQENIAKDSSLSDSYFFDEGKFALADNFALEPKDILFFYNVYEIKSYAEGETELRIPYEEIKKLLSPQGIQYVESLKRKNQS